MIMGLMENKMETTIVFGRYIGIMDNEMETTISESRVLNLRRQVPDQCRCS